MPVFRFYTFLFLYFHFLFLLSNGSHFLSFCFRSYQSKTRARAMTRCKTTDAGKTRADVFQTDRAFICIFFARGCCTQGPQCTMYHHIPKTIQDESKYGNGAVDCFGRERHMTERDDMGGVGSMMRPGRTLYIGGLQVWFPPFPVPTRFHFQLFLSSTLLLF
jgi:hypothetical protein